MLCPATESMGSTEPAEKTVDDFLTELEQDALGRSVILRLVAQRQHCPRYWD